MTRDVLEPRIELLGEEYLLVQAWKKTASYIRSHNWYSDTLELDRAAVNLPGFLSELSRQLRAPDQWSNNPLRIVPAPKSQQWQVRPGTNIWEPVERGIRATKLRPLAHVSLKDQVAATAVMLCLADRVETLQGDPRAPIANATARKQVVSYGNRLLCDAISGELRHRWGSGQLYRAYFQDYRVFLSRPETVADAVGTDDGSRVVIVQSDLRQFYDRVRPELLSRKIDALARPSDDPEFFTFARRLLNWAWDKKDSMEVAGYATQAGLSDFSKVALPQGLVAAGFFANVALLDFDEGVRTALGQEIEHGVRLVDVCRYVDDLRIVLAVDASKSTREIEQLMTKWLQVLLIHHAEGLEPSEDKTRAAVFRGDGPRLVRQSRKMERIQRGVSGGFDAIGGEEILDALQGLVRSQRRSVERHTDGEGWSFSPIPDVRNPTVARFAAWRFRSTYRSLRPLLMDAGRDPGRADAEDSDPTSAGRSRLVRSQAELDDDARAFALGLIANWVEDPSNVRLLRIGLDLWPSEEVLANIFNLLRPFTEKGGRRKAPRRVAWYCLGEIFRSGATETGFVEDDESLPAEIDISSYRRALRKEAVRLASMPPSTLPWYLRQQVLLFLAASDTTQAPTIRGGHSSETRDYRDLIRFLRGEGDWMTGADFATRAVLARRSFRGREAAVQLALRGINLRRLEQIAERDPSFALEILASRPDLTGGVSPRLRHDLCLNRSVQNDGWVLLSELVLNGEPQGALRNELAALRFASKFLEAWPAAREIEAITPSDVLLKHSSATIWEVEEVKVVSSRVAPSGSMYRPPPWCASEDRWRFQLGYLLRFVLTARQDFTKVVHPLERKQRGATYRAPDSHWYQRRYGLFNRHSGFGDDWLPISDWTERLLSSLLRWPGCRISEMDAVVREGLAETRRHIAERVQELSASQGDASGVLMVRMKAPWRIRPRAPRPLRACVVQTVIPTPDDFTPTDLTLSDPKIRKRHRNHLSAALAAIARMLDLRETHKGREGRLDWLILPELSVHPRDVRTHLVPFARAYKTIILAGLTYEALFAGKPLVNSALWVIPEWSTDHGLQIRTLRQGKQHLAADEERLNAASVVVQGFRPCQWLVGYEWSADDDDRPLWLTSSVCFDATDLRLAADLRCQSDVFAIPALNKDVTTFDHMALALHYHMFQLVIVANNGLYGGSNAYVPYREAHVRQVFHLHGQPQASIAFLEIDNIEEFLQRKGSAQNQSVPPANPGMGPLWKFPPAGI
jgi:hypothetical protein